MQDIKQIYIKASSVIEMSYIMPLFLSMFVLIVHTTFFYHDKAVINGAAAETAVVSAQYIRKKGTEYDMENFFIERLGSKLIFMSDVSIEVDQGEDLITVSAEAERMFMKINVCQKAVISEPEKRIRWMR